ncbi:hypothetical protein D3C87_795150 [compost metagenome]
MVLFDISEDRFHIVTSLLSFGNPRLTAEQLPRSGFLSVEVLVYLDNPVGCTFVAAQPSQFLV